MIGSLFAGTEESPGEMILYQEEATKHIVVWDRSERWGREAAIVMVKRT
jgi:IMP dehydrogenase/GMP reductase